MFIFKNAKITTKFMISAMLAAIVLIGLFSWLIVQERWRVAESDAKVLVQETAYRYTQVINTEIERALTQARAIAHIFQSVAHSDDPTALLTRSEVNSFLKYTIEHDNDFLATYAVFEPNAFDAKDAEFSGQPGCDSSGRFVPYWTRNQEGQAVLMPATHYDVEGKGRGNYYFIPKKTGKETITEPYTYIVKEQEYLMMSLVIPLFNRQRNFTGVVGIDLDLEKVQKLLSNLELEGYKTVLSQLYSPQGIAIQYPDNTLVGKSVKEINKNSPEFVAAVLGQDSVPITYFSPFAKDKVISFVTNLSVVHVGKPWSMVVSIPESELRQTAYQLVTQTFTVGGVAILFILLLTYWMTRGISQTLCALIEFSKSISTGKLNSSINISSTDEIGQLCASFQEMQSQLRHRQEKEKSIAEEINNTIIRAAQGDFSKRIDIEEKTDTFKLIGEGINKILDFNQLIVKDLIRVLSAIARGDLTQTISNDYSGELTQVKQNANASVQALIEMTDEINLATDCASQGDFSKRISLNTKVGSFKLIGENINRVLQYNQAVFKDLTRILAAIAQGDLTQTITDNYSGELAQLKQNANATVHGLIEITEEINMATSHGSQGDFTKRIRLDTKSGTFKLIGESINQVLQYNQNIIKDLTRLFSAFAQGDLTQTITGDYSGELAQLKRDTDVTVQVLTSVTREINSIMEVASQGDFSQRIDLGDKTGVFKTLSESINKVLEYNQQAFKDLTRVFSAMAQGDLTQTIASDYSGELAKLRHDYNSTSLKLIDMLRLIQQTSDLVSQAAAQISEGNSDLSQRTTEQAASLEETASSMEEMTVTVQQNAENAKQASQLAASAKERAEQGNHVVKEAINSISEIHKSSKKITEIITVIDEIAFQTNLLALNAAVEAARAGDQGRGFAVVATEVRNLAQRSAAAAKEIKQLIQDSNLKVEEGTRLANQSGQALEELVTAVKKVNDIVGEISAASSEQSMGIAQVNQAVTQMDEMIEQNSSLVEQSMAASQSMKEQAELLQRQVASFNIGMVDRGLTIPTKEHFKEHFSKTKVHAKHRNPSVSLPKAKAKPHSEEEKDGEDWKDF